MNSINTKSERIMQGVAAWCSYYRKNPPAFIRDYLGIDNLKLFQKIILTMMAICHNFLFCGARGISKTYTTALFCVWKAVLFPHCKIVIASKTLKQGCGVLNKITQEIMPRSSNLRNEIKEISNTTKGNYIQFKNGSIISVCVASENSRGLRANVLICDEFILMDENCIQDILKKFLTAPREVGYGVCTERNQQIYLTSCSFKSNWGWEKVKSFAVNMVDDTKSFFVCGLPYQLSIKENLLDRASVEDEMSETTFSQMNWSMEMECLWWGESESAFFKYEDLIKSRREKNVVLPVEIYSKFPEKVAKEVIKPKTLGQIRILTVDIAVMSSKKNKNDATSIFVLQMTPIKNNQFIKQEIYADAFEGGHSENQAIMIRKLYDDLECDYIVLDTNGVGMSVYDCLVKDLTDSDTGITYNGLSCINDSEMASRYKGASPNPPKVIYSVKATSSFNSQCAVELRDDLKRGKLRLLENEIDFENRMNELKAYKDLSEDKKLDLKMPFIQTSLLINELVNLECQIQGNEIKLKEHSGCRKDRYSSISYGNHICNEIERKKKPKRNTAIVFPMQAPKIRSHR